MSKIDTVGAKFAIFLRDARGAARPVGRTGRPFPPRALKKVRFSHSCLAADRNVRLAFGEKMSYNFFTTHPVVNMSNLILKISNGELFDFFDSEEKKEFVVGSKRTCDVVIKSFFVAPEQLRFLQKNNVWYVEDLTPEGYKSEALAGGKRFRRPVVKFDGDVVIRKAGERRGDTVKISAVKKISGRRGGSNFDLSHRTLTVVGRSPSCDITVDSPMVSEKHFRIVCDNGEYFIEDLRSMSGTFVNNRKVRRARLGDYDRISIPTAAYTFFDRKLLYSTSPAGIQIDAVGVTKEVTDRRSRGKVKLVSEVSFRIEPGSFVAIVGGSGTGKSTLLDCLNGIRPATGGGIYYDTNDYYDNIKTYKSVMGYVPQKDIMHDDLTVAEGLFYTAMLRMRTNMSKAEVRERVKEAIADVRLTGRENLKISSLSGGQRKRVSIAMELLSDPKVIFLDEPTSGLSPDLDLEMMDLLKDLTVKGRTIVVITHAMENLDKCDKIAFLGRNGRLCFFGRHDEVFRYFNRKSYSRIFAALNDETLCAYFEHKYRSGEYYKELYKTFLAAYPDAKLNMLPPESGKKTVKETAAEQAAEAPAKKKLSEKAAQWKAARKAKRNGETAGTETAPKAADDVPDAPSEKPARKRRRTVREATNAAALETENYAAREAESSAAVGGEESVLPSPALSDGALGDAREEGAKAETSPSADASETALESGAASAQNADGKAADEYVQTTENGVETLKNDVSTLIIDNAASGADAPPQQLPEHSRARSRKKTAKRTPSAEGENGDGDAAVKAEKDAGAARADDGEVRDEKDA